MSDIILSCIFLVLGIFMPMCICLVLVNRIDKKISILILTILYIPLSFTFFENIDNFREFIAVIFYSFLISFVSIYVLTKITDTIVEYEVFVYYIFIIILVILFLNILIFPLLFGFPNYNPLEITSRDINLHCNGVWGDFNFIISPVGINRY